LAVHSEGLACCKLYTRLSKARFRRSSSHRTNRIIEGLYGLRISLGIPLCLHLISNQSYSQWHHGQWNYDMVLDLYNVNNKHWVQVSLAASNTWPWTFLQKPILIDIFYDKFVCKHLWYQIWLFSSLVLDVEHHIIDLEERLPIRS
jgi:hypothetical protein